jgi:acetyl-CoA C-acetyltransferase
MNIDPHSPVLVGVAQIEQRIDDPEAGLEPLRMMIEATRLAAQDAGSRQLLSRADSVRVIRGVWRYGNPARVVAEEIGCPRAQTVGTGFGGNMVQATVNHAALAIQRGELDVVVITGAEHGRTRGRARKAGLRPSYAPAPGQPDLLLGEEGSMSHSAEEARGIEMAIQFYPIFESAIRHARGEPLEAHRRRISELWERFSAVAATNPHAWIREPRSAREIRTPSPTNRMVGYPYSLLMNSNNRVDQGAALLLCSAQAAERAGVPRERWVFLHAGADASDHYFVSNRDNLHSSPAIRIGGRRALELAEVELDDLTYIDVYSCFPSAVQVATQELGIPDDPAPTVTGGLTFGGGPLNNYVMHSIARMTELLRGDPGSKGFITANGGYLTKHAFGVYSTEPPHRGFRHETPREAPDSFPRRDVIQDWSGPVHIEGYTVMFGAKGPDVAHAACLLDDGRRTWANCRDSETLDAMTREEFCGRLARVDGAGTLVV